MMFSVINESAYAMTSNIHPNSTELIMIHSLATTGIGYGWHNLCCF